MSRLYAGGVRRKRVRVVPKRRMHRRTPKVSVKLTRVDIAEKNPHPWKGVIFVALGVDPGGINPGNWYKNKSQAPEGRHIRFPWCKSRRDKPWVTDHVTVFVLDYLVILGFCIVNLELHNETHGLSLRDLHHGKRICHPSGAGIFFNVIPRLIPTGIYTAGYEYNSLPGMRILLLNIETG